MTRRRCGEKTAWATPIDLLATLKLATLKLATLKLATLKLATLKLKERGQLPDRS